jgi:hypothetical protein
MPHSPILGVDLVATFEQPVLAVHGRLLWFDSAALYGMFNKVPRMRDVIKMAAGTIPTPSILVCQGATLG